MKFVKCKIRANKINRILVIKDKSANIDGINSCVLYTHTYEVVFGISLSRSNLIIYSNYETVIKHIRCS